MDYNEVFARLEEARRREKSKKEESLARELQSITEKNNGRKREYELRRRSEMAKGVSKYKSANDLLEKLGLTKSGYGDYKRNGVKQDTSNVIMAERRSLEGDLAAMEEKIKRLKSDTASYLLELDSEYNRKVSDTKQRQMDEEQRAAAAAAAAAAKPTKPSKPNSNTSGGGSSQSLYDQAQKNEPKVSSEKEVDKMLAAKGLPSLYIAKNINSAVNSGNVRAWMEENSGKIINTAGEEVWNEFMRQYKNMEYWRRVAGKPSVD